MSCEHDKSLKIDVKPRDAPILMAGQDGTNVQSLATDGYGRLVVTGKDAHNSPPTANPVLIAGWNGTNVVRLKLNTDGTVVTSSLEHATFTTVGANITIALMIGVRAL